MKFLIATAAALATPALGPSGNVAQASVVLAMDLAQMTARAERVVVAEVLSVKSAWDPEGGAVVTTVELSVAESWKGATPASRRLTLVQLGGEADGLETRVHGQASYAAGERAVLFLHGTERAVSTLGLGQGKRPLRFDDKQRRWLVHPGESSALVRVTPEGGLEPAPPAPEAELGELRSRVRTLLGR